jgi:8-oxo-dGTP pyrophosphatase MutT (NUDIX family)
LRSTSYQQTLHKVGSAPQTRADPVRRFGWLRFRIVSESPNDRPVGAGAARRPTGDPHRFLIPESQLPVGFAERLDAEPVPARPAATVVLVRDAATGPEALLLRRHNRSGFAADAWVFPGGVVDDADMDPALPVLCDGPTPEEWAERLELSDTGVAYGYAVAALREAFEETGILLARSAITEGSPGRPALDEPTAKRWRDALLEGGATLREMASEASIQYATDRLTYIAHWITPEPEPRRYDTRFFLAPVPSEAEPDLHAPELVESRWLTPRGAVEGFLGGELKMLPPTVHTLRRLAGFGTVAQMRAEFPDTPIPAILPRMRRHPEGVMIEVPNL